MINKWTRENFKQWGFSRKRQEALTWCFVANIIQSRMIRHYVPYNLLCNSVTKWTVSTFYSQSIQLFNSSSFCGLFSVGTDLKIHKIRKDSATEKRSWMNYLNALQAWVVTTITFAFEVRCRCICFHVETQSN